MNQSPVAFLGLGIMGSGMARRLLNAGHPVTVFNREMRKCAPLAAEGATVAATPRACAAAATTIFSMVTDDNASRALWLGADGLLAGLNPGTVCIESSTLSVEWVTELAARVAAKGGEFLDCPVTGSKAQVATAELKFLVGGPAETLEKVRPILATMAQEIVHLGPVGSGVFVKLVNNFLNGVQVAAFAEALFAIERSGIDPAKALGVITNGASGSPIVKTMSARMTARDYTPNFLLKLLEKDLRYAIEEGDRRIASMTMATAARQLLQQAVTAGYGDRDMSAVIETFRSNGHHP